MDSTDDPIFPPGTFETHQWGHGERAADALQRHRQPFGGQYPSGTGYRSPAHQGPGVAGRWDCLPGVATPGSYPQRGFALAQPSGDSHHQQRAQPGGQSLWEQPLPEPGHRRQGQSRSPRRPSQLQREGHQGPREVESRRQEDRGFEERKRGPSSVTLMTSGAETPCATYEGCRDYEGVFPRYVGPMSHKNILFSRAEPLEQSTRSDMATSASSATRGDVSTDFAVSEPSLKEPPLGLRLGQMGELVKNRFLEVLLHSQSTGGEFLLQFFLSPLLGTVFSLSLERLEWKKWNGFWPCV